MLAILQARMSSTRLPGKVLLPLNGIPSIKRQIDRICNSQGISSLVVAVSQDTTDDVLYNYLRNEEVEVIRGDLENVLQRFYTVLEKYPEDVFLRLTADCPLFMPEICDDMIKASKQASYDYFSNTIPPTFPDGCDIEIVKVSALQSLTSYELTREEKEHVTLGIYRRQDRYICANYSNPSGRDMSNLRWTLDTQEDYDFIQEVYKHFIDREDRFTFEEVNKLVMDAKWD